MLTIEDSDVSTHLRILAEGQAPHEALTARGHVASRWIDQLAKGVLPDVLGREEVLASVISGEDDLSLVILLNPVVNYTVEGDLGIGVAVVVAGNTAEEGRATAETALTFTKLWARAASGARLTEQA